MRKSLIVGATALSLVLAVPAAKAAYAVFDGTLIGYAIEEIKAAKEDLAVQLEQLNQLKQSLSFLNDISKFVNEVSSAIGELVNISLPIPNILKIQEQLQSDARCLMPDGMGWGIKLEDLNLASICESSSRYREALFLNQEKLKKMGYNEQRLARHLVNIRRNALVEDTTVRGLAQADVQLKNSEKISESADDLQKALNSAKTLQERAHIQAQIQLLQVRATASQNQILAQQLKLQAATATAAGLSPDQIEGSTEEKAE